jgi:hypothetical protein
MAEPSTSSWRAVAFPWLTSSPWRQASTAVKPVVNRLVDLDQYVQRETALCLRGEAEEFPKCSFRILADGSLDSPEEA